MTLRGIRARVAKEAPKDPQFSHRLSQPSEYLVGAWVQQAHTGLLPVLKTDLDD